MTGRSASICFLAATLFSASLAVAKPLRPTDAEIRVDPAKAPPGFDIRTRLVLRDAVKRSLSEGSVIPSVRRYSVSPALIQLRRYVDGSSRESKIFCIVDLALRDDQNVLLGSVRGRATVTHGTPAQALEAAAHSASIRIPQAVLAAERSRAGLHPTSVAARSPTAR